MNDRELLEKAAKAVGVEIATWSNCQAGGFLKGESGKFWNPLTSSANALDLAVALCLPIDITDEETVIEGLGIRVSHGEDAFAATRRAIVLSAAEIERRSTDQNCQHSHANRIGCPECGEEFKR